MTAATSRYLAERETTVVQIAARGGSIRVHCLTCSRQRDIPARSLPGRYADRTMSSLQFSCSECKRARRKVSISPAGHDTWHEIVWPEEKAAGGSAVGPAF